MARRDPSIREYRDAMAVIPSPAGAIRDVLRIAGAVADRADRQLPAPGPVATAWGLAKVTAVGAAAPVVGLGMATLATITTREAERRCARYPAMVDAAVSGASEPVLERVSMVADPGPTVITSDLHRCVAGGLDWIERQHTRDLYETMLDHYADEQWRLVENGDVEDYWMVGGSTWGTLYDAARMGTAMWPGKVGAQSRAVVYGEHLRRIVAANEGIYHRIEDRFHAAGRYHRVVGNHDDVYRHPDAVAELQSVHPGLEVVDAVVLAPQSSRPVLVAHGHQTDSWNGPGMAWLGRFMTWLSCGLDDAPVPWGFLGLPTVESTMALLGGRQPNVLSTIDPVVGANGSLETVDEVRLARAMAQAGRAAEDGPLVVLGHTHIVRDGPDGPDGLQWAGYLNSGCGIGSDLVTAVEWRPDRGASLVAWHPADLGVGSTEVVAVSPRGRDVARTELMPTDDGSLLSPAADSAGGARGARSARPS
ncbi:MAG: hypothetical protein JJU45_19440 [Acidimicrobiia bacterium]|nr:hypothetical protein [Acidimicrobiia bacterium]